MVRDRENVMIGEKEFDQWGVLKLKSKRKKSSTLNILLYIIIYQGLCCVFELYLFVPLLCS